MSKVFIRKHYFILVVLGNLAATLAMSVGVFYGDLIKSQTAIVSLMVLLVPLGVAYMVVLVQLFKDYYIYAVLILMMIAALSPIYLPIYWNLLYLLKVYITESMGSE